MIETLIQDLRYAVRLLLKNPRYSALAIMVLTLGIGANTAVFSAINGVLLKPLPFADPERLVKISSLQPSRGGRGSGVSLQDYLDWKEQARSFQTIAAFNPRSANISGESG
ncbi:MAG TPA: hypothetical protein VLD57_12240, partial [Blastocatellia bacterium]|nr:hypothetical protein [Blastocatellia bacterium]